MGAVRAKTFADLRRRRLQTAVLAVVLLLASGAATLALGILVSSQEPFDRAFAAANGAHLVVDYRPTVTDAQLAATTTTEPVTAAAGPYPVAHLAIAHPHGGFITDELVAGRSTPDSPVDRVTLISGRWWRAPRELVLDQETALMLGLGVGDTIGLTPSPANLPGKGAVGGGPRPIAPGAEPELPQTKVTATIVGIARSVSTPDVAAWLSPEDITAVVGGDLDQELLYRVDPSATEADLAAAMRGITADLAADAVATTQTWLQAKAGISDTVNLYVPVLLAFSIFALLAAGFTIANVVSGVVLTGGRDIGVLKAVGFTPREVSATLLGQILLPVVLGTLVGTALGTLASQPTIEQTTLSFGLPPTSSISPSVLVGVPLACLLIAGVAALVPAIRAGRLSAVTAITNGTMPTTGRTARRLRSTGLRLPLSLPVRLGITGGVAHPGRALMTLGALVVGVAAVTFALGVDWSLIRIVGQLDRNVESPVRAQLVAPDGEATVAAAIAADASIARSVGLAGADVSVPGLGTVPFVAYDGDASWIGYALIRGRWLAAPGEAVAGSAFYRRTGLQVGDQLVLSAGGREVTVRMVGEIFDTGEGSEVPIVLRGAWADLLALDPSATPDRWEIRPLDGVALRTFTTNLEQATNGAVSTYTLDDTTSDEEFLLFLSVVAFLGAILVAISLGGVFNTVLLETRQRTRELAVLKAVGLMPRQVVALVIWTVAPLAILAGLVGVPLGLLSQRAVLGYMGQTAANTAIPEVSFDVFPPLLLVALACSGLAIAVLGAYLPAVRAARAHIAPVLQAE